MKFGKKRSPEPEPIDITQRLSILDLRSSVREGAAAPVSASTAAPAVSTSPEPAVAPAPPAVPAPVQAPAAVAPAAAVAAAQEPSRPEPVAPEPAPVAEPESRSGWGTPEPVSEPAPAMAAASAPPANQAPDPVAYEMAAFELNVPHGAGSQPVPSETAHAEAVMAEAVDPEPEPEIAEPEAVHAEPEPVAEQHAPEPVAAPARPAWSYEQVARIAAAEQHVSAWVPPQAVAEPTPAAADVVDLTDPAPAADLVEHDPVYAAVEAAQSQDRGDDEVIRWHW